MFHETHYNDVIYASRLIICVHHECQKSPLLNVIPAQTTSCYIQSKIENIDTYLQTATMFSIPLTTLNNVLCINSLNINYPLSLLFTQQMILLSLNPPITRFSTSHHRVLSLQSYLYLIIFLDGDSVFIFSNVNMWWFVASFLIWKLYAVTVFQLIIWLQMSTPQVSSFGLVIIYPSQFSRTFVHILYHMSWFHWILNQIIFLGPENMST